MRRRLLLVAAITALTLGGGVATADTADARRNVGGTLPAGATCVEPGGVVRPPQADAALPCVCYALEGQRFHFLGRAGTCPPGLP